MQNKINPDVKNIISFIFIVGVFVFISLLMFRKVPTENQNLIQFFGGSVVTGLAVVIADIYQTGRSKDRIREKEKDNDNGAP